MILCLVWFGSASLNAKVAVTMANGIYSNTQKAWLPSCSFHLISHSHYYTLFLHLSILADISHEIKSLSSNLYRIVLWFISISIYV